MLAESINIERQERFPMISSDGKYLLFTRSIPDHADDVFLVSTEIIPPLCSLRNHPQEKEK
jgi:hypothetical protein